MWFPALVAISRKTFVYKAQVGKQNQFTKWNLMHWPLRNVIVSYRSKMSDFEGSPADSVFCIKGHCQMASLWWRKMAAKRALDPDWSMVSFMREKHAIDTKSVIISCCTMTTHFYQYIYRRYILLIYYSGKFPPTFTVLYLHPLLPGKVELKSLNRKSSQLCHTPFSWEHYSYILFVHKVWDYFVSMYL